MKIYMVSLLHRATINNSQLKNCSYACVPVTMYNCRTRYRTVLIIFPLILWTVVTAEILSTGGQGNLGPDIQ